MAQRSLDSSMPCTPSAEAAQPITGRGIGYKLFTAGLIPSMEQGDAAGLSLAEGGARARHIPWEWIVDETRSLERYRHGTTPKNTHGPLLAHIAGIFGTNNPFVSRSGPKRGPSVASFSRCSTSTQLASASCTGSRAPPLSTTPRKTMMAVT